MRSRPRIRWQNVAKLAAGAIGCALVLVGLPSLIRRPQPPPLEPDIGLTPASPAPARVASLAGHDSDAAHQQRRRLTAARHAPQPRDRTPVEPRRRQAQPAPRTGEPVPGQPAAAPAPQAPPPAAPAYAVSLPPTPSPTPQTPRPPPQPDSASPSTAPTEFGFEH